MFSVATGESGLFPFKIQWLNVRQAETGTFFTFNTKSNQQSHSRVRKDENLETIPFYEKLRRKFQTNYLIFNEIFSL